MGDAGKQHPVLRDVPKPHQGKQGALLIATGLLISCLSPVRILYKSLARKKVVIILLHFVVLVVIFREK